jgi:hypothetical protein
MWAKFRDLGKKQWDNDGGIITGGRKRGKKSN